MIKLSPHKFPLDFPLLAGTALLCLSSLVAMGMIYGGVLMVLWIIKCSSG